MSTADRLKAFYLRIDARSLGLFRIVMALALIGDWCMRWSGSKAFYSNEGVIPNHAHLFYALRQSPPLPVWSLFHSISSPSEAAVALLLVLLVYVFFLAGYQTRTFHLLSIVALVSLTGRNLLIEGPANYVALALLATTAFLPCGSRFSLDSLRRSFKQREEKDGTDLNDRAAPPEHVLAATRGPGWSPVSIAALAVFLQVAVIFYAILRQQSGGQWHDGTALHYALWVERWVSDIGLAVRNAPPGLLRVWSYALRYTPFLAPVLIFVPVPRVTRMAAFALMVFYGASYGLLFSFGLWGWTFVAAAFLMISTESWEAWASRVDKSRALTVIYDADCGICLWIARLLRRLDLRGHLTFQGNDALNVPAGLKPPYRSAAEESERVLHRRLDLKERVGSVPLPAEITDELANNTVIAVNEKGAVFTEGRAVTEIIRALPLGGLLSLPLRIPGVSHLLGALYRYIAPRRFTISESVGFAACGIPAPLTDEPAADEDDGVTETPAGGDKAPRGDKTVIPAVAPAVRLRRRITGSVREAGAILLFSSLLAQTARSNPWPAGLTVPQTPFFAAVTGWSRMQARYDVIAPEAPTEDGVLVVDAQTGAGKSIDPLTGKEPSFDVPRFRMGLLWSDFTLAVRKKVSPDFERSFRDYLVKGGSEWQGDTPDTRLTGLDAYWLVYKSPDPGGKAVEITGREKLFTHSRGGHGGTAVPIIKAPPLR